MSDKVFLDIVNMSITGSFAKQTLINAKQLNITKAEVPDAKTQSR